MSRLHTALVQAPQLAILRVHHKAAWLRARRTGSDRGDFAMGWVLVAAITITIVLAVGGILLQVMEDKANSLDLTTP